MENKDHSLAISSRFDAQLIAIGDWTLEEKVVLDKWLDQTSTEYRNKEAANVIAFFVSKLLGKKASVSGRVRTKYLQKNSSSLEELVSTTRIIREKFYRDHLGHMIKVALLAKAIARKEPFLLNVEELDKLVLACLFHDIAYPLSESFKIFNATIDAIKKCYFSAEFFGNIIIRNVKNEAEYLSKLIQIDERTVESMLDAMNHGFLSALEFTYYIDQDPSLGQEFMDVVRAIAIHDPEFTSRVDVLKEPIVGLLILADELQDWGRPSISNAPIIPRIENFIVENGAIKGDFPLGNDPNYSVLKQVCGKMKNLQRLVLDPKKMLIQISFEQKYHNRVSLRNCGTLLKSLYNYVKEKDICLLDPRINIDFSESDFFEKQLYGMKLGICTKSELYSQLQRDDFAAINPLSMFNIYTSSSEHEIILSDCLVNPLEGIELTNHAGNKIDLYVLTESGHINGSLKDGTDYETKRLIEYLLTTIRYINYLIYYVADKLPRLPEGKPKFEMLCDMNVLEIVSKCSGIPYIIDTYSELFIPQIIDCIKRDTFFLFQKNRNLCARVE